MTTEHSNTINPHANGRHRLKKLAEYCINFIESALTLMLRFDPKLRQLAYPLAKSGTVVLHSLVFTTYHDLCHLWLSRDFIRQ